MGSTFAGRYQIIEELGKGGMGRVYKVFDTRVQEKVALKLIRADIASDPETIERFSNELKLARQRYVTNWARAIVYVGLGQRSSALDWLEKACEEHDGWMWTLNVDPWYYPLRNEPRFQALLKNSGTTNDCRHGITQARRNHFKHVASYPARQQQTPSSSMLK